VRTWWDLVRIPWIHIVGSSCCSTALWIGYQDRKWEWSESLCRRQSPTDSNFQYPHERQSGSWGGQNLFVGGRAQLIQIFSTHTKDSLVPQGSTSAGSGTSLCYFRPILTVVIRLCHVTISNTEFNNNGTLPSFSQCLYLWVFTQSLLGFDVL